MARMYKVLLCAAIAVQFDRERVVASPLWGFELKITQYISSIHSLCVPSMLFVFHFLWKCAYFARHAHNALNPSSSISLPPTPYSAIASVSCALLPANLAIVTLCFVVRSLSDCMTINIKPIDIAFRASLSPTLSNVCRQPKSRRHEARKSREAEFESKTSLCMAHGSKWAHNVKVDDVVTVNQNIGVDSNTRRTTTTTNNNCTHEKCNHSEGKMENVGKAQSDEHDRIAAHEKIA